MVLKEKVMEVWEGEKGRKVYGARKVWLELSSRGIPVARCTVERLMRELGIRGASPGRKRPPTTLPGDPADRGLFSRLGLTFWCARWLLPCRVRFVFA